MSLTSPAAAISTSRAKPAVGELAATRTLGQRPAEVGAHRPKRRSGHPRLRTRVAGAQLGEDCARSPEVLRGRAQ